MKQAMMYEINQGHLLKQLELETTRENHVRRLNTIYQEKGKIRRGEEGGDMQKRGFMALHVRNKEVDKERKMKIERDRINHENSILRNKLIDASLPKTHNKISSSTFCADQGMSHTHRRDWSISDNYLRKQEKFKINSENAKMYIRLATMKSDIKAKLNIKDHQKKTQTLKQKLERHSPRRIKQIRTFFRKKNVDFDHSLMPNTLRSEVRDSSVENEEEEEVKIDLY